MPVPPIITTRLLHAPREQVWEAWADPRRLARWWGPEGFTNEIREFMFQTGGSWKIDMRAPDGAVYPNESVFTEVRAPGRIVIRHLGSVHEYDLEVSLEPEEGGTRMTWTMTFDSPEEHRKLAGFIDGANEQNFDRLEIELTRDS